MVNLSFFCYTIWLTGSSDSRVSDGVCRHIPCRTHNVLSLLGSSTHRTAYRFFFFHFHTHMRGSSLEQTVIKSSACPLKSLHRPHTMSFLGVPHTTLSFCSTPPLLSPTTLHTTGTRKSLNATPRLEGQSGPLADTTQSTKKKPETVQRLPQGQLHEPIV